MKNLLLTALILLLTVPCFAADGDITQVEVRPDVASWVLDTVEFKAITKTCEVTYRKVDASGDSTGLEKVILFQNIADDPSTPEDETDNKFTQLINLINNNNNLKTSIKTAVEIKLGL